MIYLDNAATTPVTDEVLSEMLPFFKEDFGNPSSSHSLGRAAREAVEQARERVAKAIGAHSPKQIFFTSGATEANNWFCEICSKKVGRRVMASTADHPSILNNPTVFIGNTKLDTQGVTHTWVNSETGYIYDIDGLSRRKEYDDYVFHTDATQAFGHLPINVSKLPAVEALSLSGHKFHAPKGVGILYLAMPRCALPLLYGGGQEYGVRAGTENVAGIVGMGKACEMYNYSEKRDKRCREIQNRFFNAFSDVKDRLFITDKERSISSILNISFKGIDGNALVTLLDADGICVSSGSACSGNKSEPSLTLRSMNVPEEYLYGSIRLSWDDTLSDEDITYTIDSIKNNVKKVRGYI